jgi:hypothetical protein
MRHVAFALVGLGLTGCAIEAATYTMTTPFREQDFTPYAGKGTGSVHGQAFLKTVGGDVKTCAGNEVVLMPATSYNEEKLQNSAWKKKLVGDDPAAIKYSRRTICDAEGKFTFDGVPRATWYLLTGVSWGVPTEYGINPQGGTLVQKVDVGTTISQVILTAADER